LLDAGVADGLEIDVHYRSIDSEEANLRYVLVKTYDGREFEIIVNLSDSVDRLKALVQVYADVSLDDKKLVFKRKHLKISQNL
jgi:hypothetical protein